MSALLVVLALLAVLVSLPFWLPAAVIALRVRIFAVVNGDEGIPVPGDLVDLAHFQQVYSHPAANGRSRGAALSDLFWYWLSPGAHVHQEHLEPGPRYVAVARTTRQVLNVPRRQAAELAGRCAAKVLDELSAGRPLPVRLRDLAMPIWAEIYYEQVFGEPCPPRARALIAGNADDVVSALKCCRLRHMSRRDALTDYLVGRITAGDVPFELPAELSVREQAYYLQGTYFNTAVVQMSEGTAHLLLALARDPVAQAAIAGEDEGHELLDRFVDDTLCRYPLFGIAHRITTEDIPAEQAGVPVAAGSVLLFNYSEYHSAVATSLKGADVDSERCPHEYIPFGVIGNRPCPARGIAPIGLRAVAVEVLRRFRLASSVAHTRSIPNRAPALLVPVGRRTPKVALVALRLRDRVEDVTRSLTQLVLGTYMVADARRQRLCRRYFAEHPA